MLGKLASGAEFEHMAQMYSEDSTRDNGGDWGWIEHKTLAEPLEKFAFNMPVGRISNIVDYAGNYYILKVEDKHGGRTKSLTKCVPTSRKNWSRKKHRQFRNAGSPACGRKPTSRRSDAFRLFRFRLIFISFVGPILLVPSEQIRLRSRA